MSDVTLFDYWRSSASYRVRIALHLAGIEYTTVPVDLVAGEHRESAHLHRNPQGFVPVLDIDGQRFTQSLAIVEYLDTTHDLGLLPAQPAERARAQALAHLIAVDIHPVCNLSVMRHATGGEEPARTAWMRHFIGPGLAAFETLLDGDGPYCGGQQPGLADVCLMPQLYNAGRWGVPTTHYTRIERAARACAGIDAFAQSHPDVARAAGASHARSPR